MNWAGVGVGVGDRRAREGSVYCKDIVQYSRDILQHSTALRWERINRLAVTKSKF
jgi:hypothetical protein